MSLLAEGIWPCTVVGGLYGADDKNTDKVQVTVKIEEGPSAGRVCTYEDEVNTKSAPYVLRSCKAIGWKEQTLKTLQADIVAWVARTGGKTTVEVKHLEIKNGKRAGQIWDKVNSIGRGPRVLKEAPPERLADADEAMRRAVADGGSAPDDDIPFLSSAMAHDVSPIAKCIR